MVTGVDFLGGHIEGKTKSNHKINHHLACQAVNVKKLGNVWLITPCNDHSNTEAQTHRLATLDSPLGALYDTLALITC